MRKLISTVLATVAVSAGLAFIAPVAHAGGTPDNPVYCPPGTTLNHYGRCVTKGRI